MNRNEMAHACSVTMQMLDALEPYVLLTDTADREFLATCCAEIRELWQIAEAETAINVTKQQYQHITAIHTRLHTIARRTPKHLPGSANDL